MAYSGTARRLQILCDGFDSRVAADSKKRKLNSQSPSITVAFSVQYNFKITPDVTIVIISGTPWS